jgi:hypothetical protein
MRVHTCMQHVHEVGCGDLETANDLSSIPSRFPRALGPTQPPIQFQPGFIKSGRSVMLITQLHLMPRCTERGLLSQTFAHQ